jgi:hypothetical protein
MSNELTWSTAYAAGLVAECCRRKTVGESTCAVRGCDSLSRIATPCVNRPCVNRRMPAVHAVHDSRTRWLSTAMTTRSNPCSKHV